MMRILLSLVVLLAAGVGACNVLLPERYAVNAPILQMLRGAAPPEADVIQSRLVVPEGFSVAEYASGLPNARFLRFTPTGDLLVSQPRAGHVSLLERDANADGRADGTRVLIGDLNRPHGL